MKETLYEWWETNYFFLFFFFTFVAEEVRSEIEAVEVDDVVEVVDDVVEVVDKVDNPTL